MFFFFFLTHILCNRTQASKKLRTDNFFSFSHFPTHPRDQYCFLLTTISVFPISQPTHVTSDNTICSNATSFIIATLSSSFHLLRYFLLFSSSSSPFLFRKSHFFCFILLFNFLFNFSVTVERVRQREMIERQGATSVKMRYG